MNEIKIHICKCKQCQASKLKMSSRTRRFYKRLTNKKRRTGKDFSLVYA